MKWRKLGRIFDPEILREQGLSAALMPIAEIPAGSEGMIRVYFSPRDSENRSQIRYFDFDLRNPGAAPKVSVKPLLLPGKLGTFDDAGVTLGSIVSADGKKLLYYTGWNLTKGAPFNNSIGIAEYSGDSFRRYGDGPVMTRTLYEPYCCASPFVLYENPKLRMWYASMDDWREEDRGIRHYYNLKYAESSDGINWQRNVTVVIDYTHPGEYAFGRPFLLKEDGLYKIWYCYRGDFYRIGYAESRDGIEWQRKDGEAGIEVSESGWDSEMLAYPYVFDFSGERYLLYNGNGYGKTGIGLAKLEE